MIEYSIEIIYGKGSPFLIGPYKTIYEAIEALEIMLKRYKTRHRTYFVDNDFYNNCYPNTTNGDYYCIKQRIVNEWTTYSEESKNNYRKNKVINFNNVKKYL